MISISAFFLGCSHDSRVDPLTQTICLMLPYRTLSPPLSSPRPLPPQPSQPPPSNCPQDLPGPSQPCTQLPSQLPASQSQSTRVTVDRGCDPIVFSDDSGSDREPEEAGGAAAGQKCKRPATRYTSTLISLALSLEASVSIELDLIGFVTRSDSTDWGPFLCCS